MNKRNLFRKAGKVTSVAAGLGSALLPSLTVKADSFIVSKDNNINEAFNKSWLSNVYWFLRFDFVKNFIIRRVSEEVNNRERVQKNVEEIKELIGKNNVFSSLGLKYAFSYRKGYIEDSSELMNKISVFSNFIGLGQSLIQAEDLVFSDTDYQRSREVLNKIKCTILYCDFFNFLIEKFGQTSLDQYGPDNRGISFIFESPIDLGNKEKCTTINFFLQKGYPSLSIQCSGQGGFANNEGKVFGLREQPVFYSCEMRDPTSLEEMEGIVKAIKEEIEKGNVSLEIYDENYLEAVKRVNRGEDVDLIKLNLND